MLEINNYPDIYIIFGITDVSALEGVHTYRISNYNNKNIPFYDCVGVLLRPYDQGRVYVAFSVSTGWRGSASSYGMQSSGPR